MTETGSARTQSSPPRTGEAARVVLSSYLGSTLEYYDFLLYGTAASLVFGPVFFSGLSPAAATIASLGTFAAGYLARPLGGVVFGHFGDLIGRKKMLVLSMAIMGAASCLIGLIPPASMIGSWGAIALVTLRVLQGVAIGGEWGGAALMALEHAEPKRRGFLAAFTNAGAPTGALLGTLAMSGAALLPSEDFLSWGWRVPFLVSAVMLALGLYVRSKVSESPVFRAAAERAARERADREKSAPPLFVVLRRPRTVVFSALACIAAFGMQTAFTTFAITYAIKHGGVKSEVLLGFAVGQFCAIFLVLGYARLSDRVGRRPVMLGGLAGMVVLVYPLFMLLAQGTLAAAAFAFIGYTLCQSATYGPIAAYISEQFGTRSRYTGASLGYQLATLVGAGFTPVILASLFASAGGSILPVGLFIIGLCLVSAVFILLGGESKDNDLDAVGGR